MIKIIFSDCYVCHCLDVSVAHEWRKSGEPKIIIIKFNKNVTKCATEVEKALLQIHHFHGKVDLNYYRT